MTRFRPPQTSPACLSTLRNVVENKILRERRCEHRLLKQYQKLQSSGSGGCQKDYRINWHVRAAPPMRSPSTRYGSKPAFQTYKGELVCRIKGEKILYFPNKTFENLDINVCTDCVIRGGELR